jgi:hypothetical protein
MRERRREEIVSAFWSLPASVTLTCFFRRILSLVYY